MCVGGLVWVPPGHRPGEVQVSCPPFCRGNEGPLLFSHKLCLTLCDPVDCSPPGSSVHGIFQTRILEWIAISYSFKALFYDFLKIFILGCTRS